MTVFEQGLEQWPMPRAQAFMEQRRQQLVTGAGSIIVPGESMAYYPFNKLEYKHRRLIGTITAEPWLGVCSASPETLVPTDPFARSEFRAGGLKVWDAAVGIPACALRPPKALTLRMVPTVRNTNTAWTQSTVPGLSRVGPLGPNGEFLRPQGPYIFDLVHDPLGWKMLEGAHALAHRAGELRVKEWKNAMYHAGKTYFHTQRFLAQLCVCRAYGLPIDVWCMDDASGVSGIGQYGIVINDSGHFRSPILKVAADGDRAPVPDTTIAHISAGVYIEPHPKGFTDESGKWLEVNRWSCSPTIVVVAGWELVDAVTHQVLCSNNPDAQGEALYYGMTPADMQGPDTFWAYLRYAAEHRGMPRVDNERYWYVEDWLQSQDYERVLAMTPPLPCMDCMRLNMRAEGAPARPIGKMPEPCGEKVFRKWAEGDPRFKAKNPVEEAWRVWERDMRKVRRVVEGAVIYHEGRLYGHLEAQKRRALRRSGYKARQADIKQIQSLSNAVARAFKQGHDTAGRELERRRQAMIASVNLKPGQSTCSQ